MVQTKSHLELRRLNYDLKPNCAEGQCLLDGVCTDLAPNICTDGCGVCHEIGPNECMTIVEKNKCRNMLSDDCRVTNDHNRCE